ncbi:MAG: AraC family transcriptional regulator [Pseudomonadota bacterium]
MQLPDAAPFTIWPSRLAAQTPGDESSPHAHHTMHLLLARSGDMQVEVGDDTHHAPGVLTAPDVSHAVKAGGLVVVLAFWDPESVDGASLRATFEGSARLISDGERRTLLAGLPDTPGREDLDAFMERARDMLAAPMAPPHMHPRLHSLLSALRDDAEIDTSLTALAARVSLSPARLMHVFTDSVGIPLRPYLLWLKLQRAATSIVNGVDLSAAAVEAGFSDAAHMSRTFKRMFGMTPSALQQRSRRT